MPNASPPAALLQFGKRPLRWRRAPLRRRREDSAVLIALNDRAGGAFEYDLLGATGLPLRRLYQSLNRLTAARLVESWPVHNWNAAVPPRTRYGITAKGWALVDAAERDPS